MIATRCCSVVVAAAFGVVSRHAERRRWRRPTGSPPRARRRPSPTASPRTCAPRSRHRHRRRVRVGRRERRDVLREPRRPERSDQAARVPVAAAGTNVYVFHEDATPPDNGGSPGNYTYSGTACQPARRSVPRHDATDLHVLRLPTASRSPTPITTLADLRSIDVGRHQPADPGARRTSPIVVIYTLSSRPQRRLQPEHLTP